MVSKFAIRIDTGQPIFLNSLMSDCIRLIPWVRPIGIAEVLRRNIGKGIVKYAERDLQLLGGNVQMCLDQNSGIEYAIRWRFLKIALNGSN